MVQHGEDALSHAPCPPVHGDGPPTGGKAFELQRELGDAGLEVVVEHHPRRSHIQDLAEDACIAGQPCAPHSLAQQHPVVDAEREARLDACLPHPPSQGFEQRRLLNHRCGHPDGALLPLRLHLDSLDTNRLPHGGRSNTTGSRHLEHKRPRTHTYTHSHTRCCSGRGNDIVL
eukprot:15451039-Alexandrium_andersonii.AAC.1